MRGKKQDIYVKDFMKNNRKQTSIIINLMISNLDSSMKKNLKAIHK